MNITPETQGEQTTLWNGAAGRSWVEAQALLDGTFKPFESLLADAVTASSACRVLDIGCGTGATTLAVARRLGAVGECVGIDISEPMVAAARVRAERQHVPARFICADAQRHAFESAAFDTIISRFGVMFFDDPVVAFSNLRRAVQDDARLRLIVWRSAAENPFMTTAERTAAPLLPDLPPRKPDGPGQFAFADKAWVHSILAKSGWTGIDILPTDVPCGFPMADLDSYLTRLGPVGRVLQEADEATRTRIVEAVRPAFDSYVHDDEVRFIAACWMILASARARTASSVHEGSAV